MIVTAPTISVLDFPIPCLHRLHDELECCHWHVNLPQASRPALEPLPNAPVPLGPRPFLVADSAGHATVMISVMLQ